MQGDDETAGEESAAACARSPEPLGTPGMHEEVSDKKPMSKDKRTVQLLAEEDFEGPRYERFADELARYAIPVLEGWMQSGKMFRELVKCGFDLKPNARELEELSRDSNLRQELADMTVALALPKFRQRALVEGGWKPERGGSITTYFVGKCKYEFLNEYRRYRDHKQKQRLDGEWDEEAAKRLPNTPSAEAEAIDKQRALEGLRAFESQREREIVDLMIDGYTQEEIREMVDAKSTRAVEAVINRWRKKIKKSMRDKEGRWDE